MHKTAKAITRKLSALENSKKRQWKVGEIRKLQRQLARFDKRQQHNW